MISNRHRFWLEIKIHAYGYVFSHVFSFQPDLPYTLHLLMAVRVALSLFSVEKLEDINGRS